MARFHYPNDVFLLNQANWRLIQRVPVEQMTWHDSLLCFCSADQEWNCDLMAANAEDGDVGKCEFKYAIPGDDT